MNKETFLIANKAKCKLCGDTIISKSRHDFVKCSCGSIGIDGGFDSNYLKRIGDPHNLIDKNVWSNSPFEVIRESLYRNGDTLLCEQNDTWLSEMINYEKTLRPNNKFLPFYMMEQDYRKKNNIKIK